MSSGSAAAVEAPAELPPLPATEALFPYPARTLEVDGGRMAYVDHGEAGSPILCVHGNPSWSFLYRRVVEHFGEDHRVVAPDHIGCGRSDKPQGWSYRVADHVANLEKLVEELDLQDITLVCHDWGGAIGMGVAGRQPSRFKRLVVMNTAAFHLPLLPLRIAVCRVPGFGALAIRGFNAFAGAATKMAVERPMDAATRAAFLAPYRDWASRIATLRFVQDIPMRPGHPSWETMQTIEKNLSKLRSKPLLAMWGMQDWCFTPAFLDRWLEHFPDAQVERYADAGHYTLEDAHERILPRMRRFLDEHGG